jgi:hypothetical protein
MIKETFYIGLNDKDTKTQVIDSDSALTFVQDAAVKYFDGATISKAIGVYTHGNGKKITEPTFKVEVMGNDDSVISMNFIASIKTLLNQESVIYIREFVDTLFI